MLPLNCTQRLCFKFSNYTFIDEYFLCIDWKIAFLQFCLRVQGKVAVNEVSKVSICENKLLKINGYPHLYMNLLRSEKSFIYVSFLKSKLSSMKQPV